MTCPALDPHQAGFFLVATRTGRRAGHRSGIPPCGQYEKHGAVPPEPGFYLPLLEPFRDDSSPAFTCQRQRNVSGETETSRRRVRDFSTITHNMRMKFMSQAHTSTTLIRSRRAVLAGIASAAALPIAAAIPTAAPAMDNARDLLALNAGAPVIVPSDFSTPAKVCTPVIEAIEQYRKAWKRVGRYYDKLEEARRAAKEDHGDEPYALIHWRNFYTGGSELKQTRETLIARGEDPTTIEREYHDAKTRYRGFPPVRTALPD
jgi:hypothetical protein